MKKYQPFEKVYYIRNREEVSEGVVLNQSNHIYIYEEGEVCTEIGVDQGGVGRILEVLPITEREHRNRNYFFYDDRLFETYPEAERVLKSFVIKDEWKDYMTIHLDTKWDHGEYVVTNTYSFHTKELLESVLSMDPFEDGKVYIRLVMWMVYRLIYEIHENDDNDSEGYLTKLMKNSSWKKALQQYCHIILEENEESFSFWNTMRYFDDSLADMTSSLFETISPYEYHENFMDLSEESFGDELTDNIGNLLKEFQ